MVESKSIEKLYSYLPTLKYKLVITMVHFTEVIKKSCLKIQFYYICIQIKLHSSSTYLETIWFMNLVLLCLFNNLVVLKRLIFQPIIP
jgi:hypothetical protein